MIEQIIYGILTGVVYAIAGWQKNESERGEVFKDEIKLDWMKLGKSVLVCAGVGAFAGYSGNDFGILIVGSIGIGATKIVDLAIKLFKSKVLGKFNKKK